MKTIIRIGPLQRVLLPLRTGSIGFVPTMGALHEGHLSLIRQAKLECETVVVSIFVNPTQFGPTEDYATYPRQLHSDRTKVKAAGADVLWCPTVDDIYPPSDQTTIQVGTIAKRWEGASRPGHFSGVATVVAKLFGVVRPDRAYFGQKDYQQSCVIRQMVGDLHLGVTLRILPTVREPGGLAMSSRNARLSPPQREAAAVLYRGLCAAEEIVQGGADRGSEIIARAKEAIEAEPLVQIDYVALCDADTLEPIERLEGKGVILLAAKVGGVRLIDNIVVTRSAKHRKMFLSKTLRCPPRRTGVPR